MKRTKKLCTLFLLVGIVAISCGPVFAQDKWSEHKTAHFVIYYRGIPWSFVQSVAQAAQDDYTAIATSLGFHRERDWMSDARTKIYIYSDAQDYTDNSQQYEWSHGAASAAAKTIRTFPAAHGFFDSTLPHELGHIIFREYIGLDADVPLWLEEGVAMYQEKAKRFGANTVVKQALKNGEFIPLMELSNMRLYSDSPKNKIDMFYAESASIVYYLINELGEYRFVQLCRALKNGNSFIEAMKSSYGRFNSIEDLSRGWLNYLEQLK